MECSDYIQFFFLLLFFIPSLKPSLLLLRPEPTLLRSSQYFQSHSLPLLRQLPPILRPIPPHLRHLPLLLKPSHILGSSPTPSKVLNTAFEACSTPSDALSHLLRSSAHFLKPLAQYYLRGNESYGYGTTLPRG